MSPAMRRRRAPLAIAAVLLSAAAMALLWALVAGDLPVAATDVFAALAGAEGMGATVIRELRLPRALAAFACGGLLATAGALMQVLLRNPLADPYILGISGGAAVGALGAMMLGAALFWLRFALHPRLRPLCLQRRYVVYRHILPIRHCYFWKCHAKYS